MHLDAEEKKSVKRRDQRSSASSLSAYLLALYFCWADASLPVNAQEQSVSIMTFNVENLFDNVHDEGKYDQTFLPIDQKQTQAQIDHCSFISVKPRRDQCLYMDWSDTALEQKLKVTGDSIKQVNGGQGPDIIALQEIENLSILERLRTEHLSDLGYLSAVLLEGNDERGIDVAFLSKFPATDAKLHTIAFSPIQKERIGDTRPILEATFDLPNGDKLTGYAVHFPAPFHPTEMRESAYAKLNSLVQRLPKDRMAFAAGDFNTTSQEDSEKNMLNRWVRDAWQIAHDLCVDCRGSSYYPPKDEWSFLDMVLWRPSDTWHMTASYLANQTAAQKTETGTPRRFQLPEATGVSDHWPLVMEITQKPHN